MVTTPHLGLTLVEHAQAQKEVTVNMALMRLDAATNPRILDKDLATPPSTPAAGDAYVVSATATGDWAGKDGYIAYFDQIWRFITPQAGMNVYVVDEACYYDYTGSAWRNRTLTTHTLTLMAGKDLSPTLSAGCAAAATISLGSSYANLTSLDFDANTQESAQCIIALPATWNAGTVRVQCHWSHASTSGAFGVVWQVEGRAFGDGDSFAQNYGSAVSITDTGGSANTLYSTPQSADITVAGASTASNLLALRISRLASNTADTLAVDARLHAVTLNYTASI